MTKRPVIVVVYLAVSLGLLARPATAEGEAATAPAVPPPSVPADAQRGEGTGAALEIKTSDGRGADALVDTWKPDVNQGGASNMSVKSAGGGRKACIRFDLSAVKEPIKGATLELTVVGGTQSFDTFNVFGVIDGEADNWIEGTGGAAAPKGASKPASQPAEEGAADSQSAASKPATAPADGMTAANAPAADLKSAGGKYDPKKNSGGGVYNSKAVFLGTFCVNNAQYAMSRSKGKVHFGSPALVEFLGKDANRLVTFIITRVGQDSGSWTVFGTKEGDHPPVLKVSSEPLPAPAQPVQRSKVMGGFFVTVKVSAPAESGGPPVVTIDDKPVAADALDAVLAERVASFKAGGAATWDLEIAADPVVPCKDLLSLLEAARKNGFANIMLSPPPPPAPAKTGKGKSRQGN